MRILHYSLGFPPYRSGGLTKFCIDLMKQQMSEDIEVGLLWPGRMGVINKKTSIYNKGSFAGIKSYEIYNPAPVPYNDGIAYPKKFMVEGSLNLYLNFLESYKPDVIHVHTLMGIHKNFIIAARKLKIRTVFTTHDYYPICPKVTMYHDGGHCPCVKNPYYCESCNKNALPMWKIWILQSALYRHHKDSPFVKKLRTKHREQYIDVKNNEIKVSSKEIADDYERLRKYNEEILNMIDVIHFNSSLTKEQYNRYLSLKEPKQVVIPISHSNIKDNRKKKRFNERIKITYLGVQSDAKGYSVLTKALNRIWDYNSNFHLNIFFKPVKYEPYMKVHRRYQYNQLENIFDNTDILVAPSLCKDTFGFTVLEALSYATPVMVSSNVGAKDIIPKNGGIIVNNINVERLITTFQSLTPTKLKEMNKIILRDAQLNTIEDVNKEINLECYK